MGLSPDTKNRLALALTSVEAANEVNAALSSDAPPTPATAPVNVAVTFSATPPANYASPVGTLTILAGATPTVVELVEYCDELRGVIAHILTVLHAQGITT